LIRISQIRNGTRSHLLVEGKLSDGGVDVLETSWLEAQSQLKGAPVHIDLSGVTYVDSRGHALLERMIRSGTELRATGVMLRTIIEGITNRRN
jgi:ABC-type transporter Mla MlaB component